MNDKTFETALATFIDHHQQQKDTHPWSLYRLGVIFIKTQPVVGWEYLELAAKQGIKQAEELIKTKRIDLTPAELQDLADTHWGNADTIDKTFGNPFTLNDDAFDRGPDDLPIPSKAQPLQNNVNNAFQPGAFFDQFVPDMFKNQPVVPNENDNL